MLQIKKYGPKVASIPSPLQLFKQVEKLEQINPMNCNLHYHTLMRLADDLASSVTKKLIGMEQHIFYISSEILCTFSVELGHLKTWSLVEQTGFQVKTFEFWVQTNSDHQGENLRKCTYSQTQMIWQQGTVVSHSDVTHSNQSQNGPLTDAKSH